MTSDRYSISYGPPLAVRDRPHREMDTAVGVHDTPEYDGAQPLAVSECDVEDAIEMVEASVNEVMPINCDG